MTAIVAVALILAAGCVLTLPGRSRVRPPPRPSQPGRAIDTLRRLLAGVRSLRQRRARPPVARVLVEVAARLRAGAGVAEAWREALPRPVPRWAMAPIAAAGVEDPGWAQTSASAAERSRDGPQESSQEVVAATAACALAGRTGAPLAEVIDIVVAGIAEAGDAEHLRRTALAGPRATARLLAWLPIGGIGLGVALGADPLATLLGGGVGGLCLVVGGALFLAGHRWVGVLVRRAERAGR